MTILITKSGVDVYCRTDQEVLDNLMIEVDGHLAAVRKEIERALLKHPVGFHSGHEGYGVILEELDELWDEVRADDTEKARTEAVQVAAMAIRFLMDVHQRPDLKPKSKA